MLDDNQLSSLDTEQQNHLYHDLDKKSALEIVRLMNKEDQSVPMAISKVLPVIADVIEKVSERLRIGGRVFYVGAGTSGRLGILDAAECPPTFGVDPELIQGVIAGGKQAVFTSIELAEDDENAGATELKLRGVNEKDVVIGLAASGRTPFVIGALKYARKVGALAVSVTSNPNSLMAKESDNAIEIETGPEILAGSTRLKAGTAQKLVLNMISTGAMVLLGKVYHNMMVDLQATNAKLSYRARGIVMSVTGVSYDVATEMLDQAKGNVKLAILMVERNIDSNRALELLDTANGDLRQALSL